VNGSAGSSSHQAPQCPTAMFIKTHIRWELCSGHCGPRRICGLASTSDSPRTGSTRRRKIRDRMPLIDLVAQRVGSRSNTTEEPDTERAAIARAAVAEPFEYRIASGATPAGLLRTAAGRCPARSRTRGLR
jgi:hypothetical protein